MQLIRFFIKICAFGFFLLQVSAKREQNDVIKIGALFDGDSRDQEVIFKYAIEAINNQRNKQTDGSLGAVFRRVEYGNVFEASQNLCRMMKNGISGVIGPSSPMSAKHVQNICDTKEMPLIETRYDMSTEQPVINLYPHPEALGRVFLDLVVLWDWDGFSVLYETASWLPHVDELLQMYDTKGFTVTVRQLDQTANGNYRPQLRRVKLSGDKKIIISCSIDALPEILKQAQQVGLLSDEHQIIITSLDLHTIDLEPFQHGGTNITGVRLIVPDDEMVKQVTDFIAERIADKKERKSASKDNEDESNSEGNSNEDDQDDEADIPDGLTADQMRVETALTYDAVLLFSEVVKNEKGVKAKNLRCDDDSESRVNGMTDSNAMKTIPPIRGLSGEIHFDQRGHRSEFKLEIIELASDGIQRVGSWTPSEGLNMSRYQPTSGSAGSDESMRNKSFIVLTALSDPYGMLKETALKLTGNDRFEGFGIELIQKLSEKLGFNYTFRLQEDGAYGSFNKDTGEWNGMIRELMDDRADLAITDLTITSDRESAADFTMPFMNLGISILFQKPQKEPPSLFSFMSPFSKEVWLYLAVALFLVSLSLFIMGRLSPAEWDNPYPCIEEPDMLENQFSFRNSVWFAIGALLQQGSEIAPKAPSTRIAASLWWFFTLIMVSSYTANLAAFLTIESLSSPINNVEDLANADGSVPYGAKRGGSTFGFFKESDNPIYQNMYQYMMNHPEHMTSSNDEGLNRAKAGKYAYLMESSSIEYIIERNCEVTQVGGELDAKGYGIAMKKNSPYRGALSEAVLQMQESGDISKMKIKYWKEKRGGGACTDGGGEEGGAEELEVANVGGVFILLIVGGGVAIIASIVDLAFTVRSRAADLEVSFAEELKNELRFVVKCSGNTKTVRHRKSSSRAESIGSEVSHNSSKHSNTPHNDTMKPDIFSFRPSLKNIQKEDLKFDCDEQEKV